MERKIKLRWWLLLLVVITIPIWFFIARERNGTLRTIGLAPAAAVVKVKQNKPICSQVIVPVGADCIPQHMANLPPDPGEAGKLTIDGVDADKDGVRDDVQRFIHEQWPDSERARQVLFLIAKYKQSAVHHGGDLSKEETRKLMPMNQVLCYSRVSLANGDVLMRQNAMEEVQNKVTNTPERWARAADFSYQLAHNTYEMPDDNDIPALCGFDPNALPN